MSTNYYYVPAPPCKCCGRFYPEVHIGKSAGGWKFIIRATEPGDTWADVRERLRSADSIRDEYGHVLTADEMIAIVEGWQDGRSHADDYPEYGYHDPDGYVMHPGEFS